MIGIIKKELIGFQISYL